MNTTTPEQINDWSVRRYPLAEGNKTRIVAVRGEGTNRQVINVLLTPDAAALWQPSWTPTIK